MRIFAENRNIIRLMTKQEIIDSFDPNAPAVADGGLFGLPFTAEHADIIIIPVPWEVTVSFGSGTGEGPDAIKTASGQVDLYHQDFPELWKRGIFLDSCPAELVELGKRAKDFAGDIIAALEEGEIIEENAVLSDRLSKVNHACDEMNRWVKERAAYWKGQGKLVGLIGGDHSVPLGYLQLQGDLYRDFGILHIDAHMDLRQAYEGFTYSHASIFYNAMERIPGAKLVQVGIRDFCEQEHRYAKERPARISVFTDRSVRNRLFKGENWDAISRDIIDRLPQKVHISLDIDGLNPSLCPNTGTPVPGGLEYEELIHLLNTLKASGREIIGFDMCEVSASDNGWDENVGARLLFHLCGVLAG